MNYALILSLFTFLPLISRAVTTLGSRRYSVRDGTDTEVSDPDMFAMDDVALRQASPKNAPKVHYHVKPASSSKSTDYIAASVTHTSLLAGKASTPSTDDSEGDQSTTISDWRFLPADHFLRKVDLSIKVGPVTRDSARRRIFRNLTPDEQAALKSPSNIFYYDIYAFFSKTYGQLAYRFQVHKQLGRGNNGAVYLATDHKEHRQVALKICNSPETCRKEAHMMIRLKQQNLPRRYVQILDSFDYLGKHVIVMPVMQGSIDVLFEDSTTTVRRIHDLEVLKRHPLKYPPSTNGLREMHKENIIHNDLKMDNILVESKSPVIVKLGDFSNSCVDKIGCVRHRGTPIYEAPESILGAVKTTQADMWSFGLLVAEMYTGRVLLPVAKPVHRLVAIALLLGEAPPQPTTSRYSSRLVYKQAIAMFRTPGLQIGVPRFQQALAIESDGDETEDEWHDLVVDFVQKCLRWNPQDRMTAEQALRHDFLSEF